MSTKQDIIRPEDNLIKEKKDIIENSNQSICLSPSKSNINTNIINDNCSKSNILKKGRCFVDGCNKRVVKIIGDCKYCSNKFCEKHRLPELHLCSKMNDVRNKSKNILENKLMNEKCVSSKIDSF